MIPDEAAWTHVRKAFSVDALYQILAATDKQR